MCDFHFSHYPIIFFHEGRKKRQWIRSCKIPTSTRLSAKCLSINFLLASGLFIILFNVLSTLRKLTLKEVLIINHNIMSPPQQEQSGIILFHLFVQNHKAKKLSNSLKILIKVLARTSFDISYGTGISENIFFCRFSEFILQLRWSWRHKDNKM